MIIFIENGKKPAPELVSGAPPAWFVTLVKQAYKNGVWPDENKFRAVYKPAGYRPLRLAKREDGLVDAAMEGESANAGGLAKQVRKGYSGVFSSPV